MRSKIMADNDDQKKEDGKLPEGTDEAKELKDKFDLCERERDEYLAGWRRTKADLTNFKAEEMKRLEDVVKFGNEEIVKDMISVLQSFELAIQSTEDDKNKEGIARIRNQLEETLKRYGLQKIIVKIGDKFNPQFQEALLQDDTKDEPDTILEELSCGYMLHGKVIKTAKVKIAK